MENPCVHYGTGEQESEKCRMATKTASANLKKAPPIPTRKLTPKQIAAIQARNKKESEDWQRKRDALEAKNPWEKAFSLYCDVNGEITELLYELGIDEDNDGDVDISALDEACNKLKTLILSHCEPRTPANE